MTAIPIAVLYEISAIFSYLSPCVEDSMRGRGCVKEHSIVYGFYVFNSI